MGICSKIVALRLRVEWFPWSNTVEVSYILAHISCWRASILLSWCLHLWMACSLRRCCSVERSHVSIHFSRVEFSLLDLLARSTCRWSGTVKCCCRSIHISVLWCLDIHSLLVARVHSTLLRRYSIERSHVSVHIAIIESSLLLASSCSRSYAVKSRYVLRRHSSVLLCISRSCPILH